jgi:hypothetical protein
MQIYLAPCYYLPPRSKYYPQHPVLKHPQSSDNATSESDTGHNLHWPVGLKPSHNLHKNLDNVRETVKYSTVQLSP